MTRSTVPSGVDYTSYSHPPSRRVSFDDILGRFGGYGLILGVVDVIVMLLLKVFNLESNGLARLLYQGLWGTTFLTLCLVFLSFIGTYFWYGNDSWGWGETAFIVCLAVSIVLTFLATMHALLGMLDWSTSLLNVGLGVVAVICLACFQVKPTGLPKYDRL